jgi:hypothetical protein
MVRQYIMAEEGGGAELFTYSSQEADRERWWKGLDNVHLFRAYLL